MTTSLNLDPRARLEDVLDLPLGTVVADNQGVDHVYIGMRPNTAGHELHFMPHAGTKLMNPASYALVEGGLRKFPGLARFVRGALVASPHAGTEQSVEEINAIVEPETGLRVEHADSPGGPFLRLLRKTGPTWETHETVGVFPRDVGAGTLTCVGPVARHFYNLGVARAQLVF